MDKNQLAVAVFDKHADLYQQKFMNVDLYADSLALFCEQIAAPEAEILELACGPGNITAWLLKHRPDFRIFGTDLAPNMVELARRNNPGARFEIMDARAVAGINRKFHGIMCGFVLPYLTREETEQLIRDASALLHPGGLLYLSTMEDDYEKSGIRHSSSGDQLYMYFHTAAHIEATLQAAGFRVADLRRKLYAGPDGAEVRDLVVLGVRG